MRPFLAGIALVIWATTAPAGNNDYSRFYEKNKESVVFISTDTGLGSGVQIANGKILTAAHMVKDVEKCIVDFTDNVNYTADVVWSDEKQDLALLRIVPNKHKVAAIHKGNINIGTQVFDIGNPFGIKWTFSTGWISNVTEKNFMFTAPISPGNSGCPVFDDKGAVEGICLGYYQGGENLNLASKILLPPGWQSN